ncbi:MAG TPA: LamG domain-containing protein [Candidatus Krumholzibacteria bacterium]|nr:LamG domain-containing protein [Candidatus Krumholzibacteria bacterium]
MRNLLRLPVAASALLLSLGTLACDHESNLVSSADANSVVIAPAVDDAVLFMRFDGNILDESVYGQTVTIYGSEEYRDGCSDDAIMFDGGEYVQVFPDLSLEPANVTVEVWMSPKRQLGDNSGFNPLVVKYSGNFWNTVDGYDLWYQDSGAGGRVGFGIGTQGGTIRKHASLTTDLLPSRPYHIVGTFDGHYARLYLNGEEVAATAHDQPLAYLGGGIRIGGGVYHSFYGGTQYYRGIIDQVAIYPRAMSADEIGERSRACKRIALVDGAARRDGGDAEITSTP